MSLKSNTLTNFKSVQPNDKIEQQSQSKNYNSIQNKSSSLKSASTQVLPLSQLQQIKERLLIGGDSESFRKTQEKTEMHAKSQQRIQNWPNTLQALRRKKDDARFEKFKKDEEERRKIDEEEAILAAKTRKEIIEKANKQLYENNDKVKSFQSKLLLVDAVHERNYQLELKKQMKEIEKIREQQYLDQQREIMKQEEEEEQMKQDELNKKKKETQKVLSQQHEIQKQNYIYKMQQEKIEGEIIKSHALDLIEEEKEQERLRRLQAKQNQEEVFQHNQELQAIRQKEKLKEQLLEKEIKKHAERKERVADMRKKRELQLFEQKQDIRQKIIDKQVKNLKEIKEKQEATLNKQIREAEIKAEQIELRKKQQREQLVKRIDQSIKQNLDKKRVQTAAAKLEDANFKDFWQSKNLEIQQKEKQDKVDAQGRSKELQNFHKKQIQEKQKIRELQFIEEIKEAEDIQRQHENDDKVYRSWAEQMIEQWKSDGKDILPLLKLLNSKK